MSRTKLRIFGLTRGVSSFLLIALLALAGLAHAQQQQPQQVAAAGTDASKESLTINPGDLVHVSVFGEPDLDQKARVNDSGVVSLSMIGPVKVAGLTPFEASRMLREKYISGDFLKNPQVSVLVEEYSVENVSVLGEVTKPGAYPIVTPRNLLDVVAMAGGLTAVADRHITVERKNNPSQRTTVFIPNDSSTALDHAVLVYPGDVVLIPKAPIVYVLGDVARPGGYPMSIDTQITVLQSIAAAGGTAKTAAEGRARLIRRTGDNPNGYTEQQFSLKDMQKGKLADMQLQPNDIVYVPFSWGKNIAIGASSIISSTSGAAVYHQ